jgi:hypothetical protein
MQALSLWDEKQPHPRDTAWAMSEENVELVRRTYEAAYQGDYDASVAVRGIGRFRQLWAEPMDTREYRGWLNSPSLFPEWDERAT